jgi:hypothetical protein
MKPKRNGQYDFRTEVYVLDQDGGEHEVNVRVWFDCDYDAGRISGPPENCYPPSGDLEFTDIEICDELPAGITDEMVREAAAESDRLTEEAWEHYHSMGVDDGR